MPELVYRRSPADTAAIARRFRVVGWVVAPAAMVFVAFVQHLVHPDWKDTLVALGVALPVVELMLLLVRWMARRWDWAGEQLELVLGDGSLTLRRPGFVSTIAYRDIEAVRGRTEPTGELRMVEVFRPERKVSRIVGFEDLQDIYGRLAEAAGGRALVEPMKPRRVLASRAAAGVFAGVFVAVFVARKLWSGWSFEDEIAYLCLPALFGGWILWKRPFTNGGFLAKKGVETAMGLMALASSLLTVLAAWGQRPLEQTLFVDGRTLRSPQLGFELELPAPWEIVPLAEATARASTASTAIPRGAENTFRVLRNTDTGTVLTVVVSAATTARYDPDAALSVTNPAVRRVSDITDATVAGIPLRKARQEWDDPSGKLSVTMSIGRKSGFVVFATCMVKRGMERNLGECDRLLEGAREAP